MKWFPPYSEYGFGARAFTERNRPGALSQNQNGTESEKFDTLPLSFAWSATQWDDFKGLGFLSLDLKIVLYGFDPFDPSSNLTRPIDGLLRVYKTAQLHNALVGFYTDFEGLEKIISGKQGFYLGSDDRAVNVFAHAFMLGCRGAGCKSSDQHNNHQILKNDTPRFHRTSPVCQFVMKKWSQKLIDFKAH